MKVVSTKAYSANELLTLRLARVYTMDNGEKYAFVLKTSPVGRYYLDWVDSNLRSLARPLKEEVSKAVRQYNADEDAAYLREDLEKLFKS